MRVVLDTDVIVAAMRSPAGASAALLRAVRAGKLEIVINVPLAMEYEAVCRQGRHVAASGLSPHEVDIYISTVIAMAKATPTYFAWRPQLRDPADEFVLDAAINGRVNALITFNRADYGSGPGRFGIEVLLPREALQRIKS